MEVDYSVIIPGCVFLALMLVVGLVSFGPWGDRPAIKEGRQ